MRTRAATVIAVASALCTAFGASASIPGAALGHARGAGNRAGAAALSEAQAEALGEKAYIYGIPLMEFLRQARQQTSVTVPNSHSDAPLNQLGSARFLATANNQVIVQPNNDTLYTMGHLDLTHTALVLHVPMVPHHRYYSFEFIDPYTNVFHYIGTRTTGDGAGNFLLTGPKFRGHVPAGLKRIRSQYEHVWLVGRTLAGGPSDLPAVHKVQDHYKLIPLADFVKHGLRWNPPRPNQIITTHTAFTEPKGVAFFDQLGTALAQNPPPKRDDPILRELRQVGVGVGLHPSQEHLSADVLAGLAAAADNGYNDVFTLRTGIAAASVAKHNGWFVPPFINGAFGTNYDYRAVVALFGIAANRPQEALYIIGVTSAGSGFLNGAHDYLLHFPAGQLPPARFFWSLTMYDQSFFLVPNSINRYALGSHTAGLKRNPDGSLDIYIQHSPPPGHESNWLPAPTGQFEVTLRLYGPKSVALQQRYVYPAIQQTS
jgi:hypothetical protein